MRGLPEIAHQVGGDSCSVLRLYLLSLWKSVAVVGPLISRPFKVSCHGYSSMEPASSHAFNLDPGNRCGIKLATGGSVAVSRGLGGVCSYTFLTQNCMSTVFSGSSIYTGEISSQGRGSVTFRMFIFKVHKTFWKPRVCFCGKAWKWGFNG